MVPARTPLRLVLDGLVLRTAWLFLGAAIGLAALLLAGSVAGVLGPTVPGPAWGLTLACGVPFLLLGLLPGVRELEVTAARSMLGVTADLVVPARPTADHRRRTAAWAVLHLVAGLLTAVSLVGLAPGVVVTVVTVLRGRPLDLGPVVVPAVRSPGAGVAVLLAGLAALLVCGAVAWALGRLAARTAPRFLGPTAADRLQVAEERLAAEAEHVRLARDLHDGIGHALTAIAVQAAAGRRVLDRDPDTAGRALGAVADTARRALADLDGVLAALRDEAPGDETPRSAGPGVQRLPVLLAAHADAGMDLVADLPDLAGLPELVSTTVLAVVAEGLTNAHRYAGPGRVTLVVRRDADRLTVTLDSPRAAAVRRPTGGRGLAGLRERVEVLGGSLAYGPEQDRWRLHATLPSGTR